MDKRSTWCTQAFLIPFLIGTLTYSSSYSSFWILVMKGPLEKANGKITLSHIDIQPARRCTRIMGPSRLTGSRYLSNVSGTDQLSGLMNNDWEETGRPRNPSLPEMPPISLTSPSQQRDTFRLLSPNFCAIVSRLSILLEQVNKL